MTIAKEPKPPLGIYKDINLPTEEIFSDEPPLETVLHLDQIILLLTSLQLFWDDRNDFFAAANLSIYYSPHQVNHEILADPTFLWCWTLNADQGKAGQYGKKIINFPIS